MATALTIQQIIDQILSRTPYDAALDTVDTVKTGDASQPLRGIVTTFMASYEVIDQAIAAGANLIITHEPTFYNHLDATDWLARDAVYAAKRKLIDEQGLVIWRFHDYWHRHQPDGIITGVLRTLGWEECADAEWPYFVSLPPTTIEELIAQLKAKLDIPMLRVVGQPGTLCRRAALLVGAIGGRPQIEILGREDIDVLICGEINEWEINEYTRDAIQLGRNKALIVTGHAPSEEAGMAWLAEWLREQIADVPIAHVPSGSSLRFA